MTIQVPLGKDRDLCADALNMKGAGGGGASECRYRPGLGKVLAGSTPTLPSSITLFTPILPSVTPMLAGP